MSDALLLQSSDDEDEGPLRSGNLAGAINQNISDDDDDEDEENIDEFISKIKNMQGTQMPPAAAKSSTSK